MSGRPDAATGLEGREAVASHNRSSPSGDLVPAGKAHAAGDAVYGDAGSLLPPAADLAAGERRERARTLGPARRLAMLASFARGRDISVNTSERSYPELQGLHRFQRWLTQSRRITDADGSAWWSEVNGLLLLDMVEAAALSPGDAIGRSAPVRAWAAYWAHPTKGGRTRLCWAAHQCSLDEAGRAAEGVLALEPPTERDFIRLALASVEIAALANLPTGRGGSRVVGGFCRVFYPAGYPAEVGAGAGARSHLTRATGGRRRGMRLVARVIRGRFRR